MLGNKVKDIVSSLEGIATAEYTSISGYLQIGIRPEAKEDGSVSEAYYVDIQQIEVLEERVVSATKANITSFEIGDIAEDKITGLEGTIIGRQIYLNGCVEFYIKPRRRFFGIIAAPEAAYSSSDELKLIRKAHTSTMLDFSEVAPAPGPDHQPPGI